MVLLVYLVVFLAFTGHSSATYCLCKDGVSEEMLQKALDYACGAGADCSPINKNGPCFNPNTVKDHCNYAVNSYFQKKGQAQGSCDFTGTAAVSSNPPPIFLPVDQAQHRPPELRHRRRPELRQRRRPVLRQRRRPVLRQHRPPGLRQHRPRVFLRQRRPWGVQQHPQPEQPTGSLQQPLPVGQTPGHRCSEVEQPRLARRGQPQASPIQIMLHVFSPPILSSVLPSAFGFFFILLI
ncbi:uncharacterized protein LOC120187435 isoform X2 [Hibiscus syriacus]|uniref:uncharacterized protein LOC120187435 isoform X2 n=1 Tax=Hibiscus syriacus TaxID=106335 RepID=UPI0019226BFB|nr:uncharacterized protein LOC120187435 isoform X2 [Hibiscus syriacus]